MELWLTDSVIEASADDGFYTARTDADVLIAKVVDESRYPDFRASIREAYEGLVRRIWSLGYPHIVRVWNYLADINQGDGDSERYRQFCLGRHEAFMHSGHAFVQMPAASALGLHGVNTLIYMLASKVPPRHFENPRQISAYHYPRLHGPVGPSFARATLSGAGDFRRLYVSGTASILGHQSMHIGDFDRQLALTCENVDVLLRSVGEQLAVQDVPRMSMLKVYLRHRDHLAVANEYVRLFFGQDIPVIFLHADICRRELLVEIDGHADLVPYSKAAYGD